MTLPLALMFLSAQIASAQSGSDAVVVRLEPGRQVVSGTPMVTLKPLRGEAVSISLKDDGSKPDIAAEDGRWAGITVMKESTVAVSVDIGPDHYDAGTVSWDADAPIRDLVLTLTWGGVTAMADSTPQVPMASSPAAGPSLAMSASAVPAVASSKPLMWGILGVGLLFVLGGLGLALRNARPPLRAVSLDRVPEPPVLGPGTPALHEGLSVWTVSESDRAQVVETMLRTMARRHRVLLRLPEGAEVPTTLGGPVYLTHASERGELESHLLDILERPGLPVAVLFVGVRVAAAVSGELADILDPGVGGILLATELEGGQAVDITVKATISGVELKTRQGMIMLVDRGEEGYFRLAGFIS